MYRLQADRQSRSHQSLRHRERCGPGSKKRSGGVVFEYQSSSEFIESRTYGMCSVRFSRVTACQECAWARICPRCVTPVQPIAESSFLIFGSAACSQSLYALASISCVLGPGIGHFSGLEHGPALRGLEELGGTVPDQLGDWPPDLSSHEAASSSPRLPTKQTPWLRRLIENESQARDYLSRLVSSH